MASDSDDTIAQVRHSASQYFPKAKKKSILWISGETKGKLRGLEIKSHTIDQVSCKVDYTIEQRDESNVGEGSTS